MKQLWRWCGNGLFWLCWPALWLILHNSQRTRVLIVARNKVLLLQNWLSPGAWSLSGGGRHRQETAVTAAVREVREEVGITIAPETLTSLGQHISKSYGIQFSYELFMVELAEPAALRCRSLEVQTAGWFDKRQCQNLRLSSDAVTALHLWS